MVAESDDLVSYGMLETKYYRDGDNHYSQANGNTNGGYRNNRATNFLLVALIIVYPLCYYDAKEDRILTDSNRIEAHNEQELIKTLENFRKSYKICIQQKKQYELSKDFV